MVQLPIFSFSRLLSLCNFECETFVGGGKLNECPLRNDTKTQRLMIHPTTRLHASGTRMLLIRCAAYLPKICRPCPWWDSMERKLVQQKKQAQQSLLRFHSNWIHSFCLSFSPCILYPICKWQHPIYQSIEDVKNLSLSLAQLLTLSDTFHIHSPFFL